MKMGMMIGVGFAINGLTASGGGGGDPAPDVPTIQISPSLSTLLPVIGTDVVCGTGSWAGSPTSYTYQWLNGGSEISGQTTNTLDTTGASTADRFTCEVTAHNAIGVSLPALSDEAAPIDEPPVNSFYYRVSSGDLFFRPDGTSKFKRPA